MTDPAVGPESGNVPEAPGIFISCHYVHDQKQFESFRMRFAGTYRIYADISAHRRDERFTYQHIRQDYIKKSKLTVVLCGAETWKCKYIDWEIFATLYQKNGLIGVNLPGNTVTRDKKFRVPPRLHKNIESGYAVWLPESFTDQQFAGAVGESLENARCKSAAIRNQDIMLLNNVA